MKLSSKQYLVRQKSRTARESNHRVEQLAATGDGFYVLHVKLHQPIIM